MLPPALYAVRPLPDSAISASPQHLLVNLFAQAVMAGESSINPLRNQTPLTTFARNLRKKEVYPYVSTCHPFCGFLLATLFCFAWRVFALGCVIFFLAVLAR